MMMDWKDIHGYDGAYQVSSCGSVRSVDRSMVLNNGKIRRDKGYIIKPIQHPKGYMYITLSKNGFTKRYLLHRLVANEFLENPENKPQVNHKNGDKSNNSVGNLEWVTGLENINHAFESKLIVRSKDQYRSMMKKVECVDLGLVFESVSEAISFLKDNGRPKAYSSSICDCANGKVKSAYGFKWKYGNT
jgi:hypothetical protein